MQTPLFSIIIPTYNRAHLIKKTIDSVVEQLFTDWELLVIDDGSIDNTKAVVEKFADPRIKYIWQKNQERSVARNNGISLSKGKYICFLDSDDHWQSDHLQLISKKINAICENPSFYFTGMKWNFPNHKQNVVFESPEGKNLIEYVITNQIAPSTVCIHAAILKEEKFNPCLRINEDVELFARIVAKYPLIQLPQITVDFIIHEENTKANEKNLILPQIVAMKIIFSNPVFKNGISTSFKKNRLRNLHHELINHYLNTNEFKKMKREIIKFLFHYPLDFQNKSRIILLLYHMPGGFFLKKFISSLKN